MSWCTSTVRRSVRTVVEASGRIADTIVCRDSFAGAGVSELTRKQSPARILRQFGRCDSGRNCRFMCRGSQLRRSSNFFLQLFLPFAAGHTSNPSLCCRFFNQFFTFISLPLCERIELPPLTHPHPPPLCPILPPFP